MRLADFIEREMESILSRWEAFARTLLPAARSLDSTALRDHAEAMLRAVVADLRTDQTADEQDRKSRGLGPAPAHETAAQTHAVLRAEGGFGIRQLVSEYRALRASVLRQYVDAGFEGREELRDIGRFNEALDQAVAESVDFFTAQVERWRSIFLGVLGHDLRGPLQSILLSADLLSKREPTPETVRYIESLQRSGERMAELLDDLLDFNRVAIGGRLDINRQPMDLAATCRQEIELLRGVHGASSIDFDVRGPCEGDWDASRVRQALANLVDNAVKYGDGGPVRVSVRREGADVVICVENDGPTIDEGDLASIFEPLKRGRIEARDRERTHFGLGLFIVRQTAEAHGGEVVGESKDGHTRFSIRLPVTASPGGR